MEQLGKLLSKFCTITRAVSLLVVFFATSSVCLFIAVVLFPAPVRYFYRFMSTASILLRGSMRVAGLDIEIRGREHIPTCGCIVALKHQSILETVTLFDCYVKPLPVLKRNLLWIPPLALSILKLGGITVSKKDGSIQKLREMVDKVGACIKEGQQIIIFPEGERRSIGAKASYKGGTKYLYSKIGVPVVPAALNTGLFWSPHKSIFQVVPGKAVIEFLPAIPPNLKPIHFHKLLMHAIETASDRLELEATQSMSKTTTA